MTIYRICPLDTDSNAVPGGDVHCVNEGEALVRAQQMATEDTRAAVWQASRHVATVSNTSVWWGPSDNSKS